SFLEEVKPIIYDSIELPFDHHYFDVALLITVLHHTKNPRQIVAESRRVAKKVIVIEEIYSNIVTKYLTFLFDSIFNFELFGHSHTNMTDTEWRGVFDQHGLKIRSASYKRSMLVLKRVLYVLENDNSHDPVMQSSVLRQNLHDLEMSPFPENALGD